MLRLGGNAGIIEAAVSCNTLVIRGLAATWHRRGFTNPEAMNSRSLATAARQEFIDPFQEVGYVDSYRPNEQNRTDVAHIGKSVVVKGELSGSEDLYLDGEVEGSIELRDHNLTIGPNGHVRADINAKEIVVHGKVDGNISGSDRVELRKSAVLVGDIATQRIVIEDGAYFKGGIDTRKDKDKDKDQGPRREQGMSTPSMPVTPVTSPLSPFPETPVSSTRG